MNEAIIYILKVVAIHGLLYLFYRLVLRNTGRHSFNRGFLLLAVIAAFFIPLLKISLPEEVHDSQEIAVIMWLSEPASGIEEFELVPVEQGSHKSYWYLIPGFYVVVVMVLLLRSLFYLILLTRLKKHSEIVRKRWFKLFKISHDRPFSFFSNVFIPKKLFGTEAFEQILTHECEHVRQFHSFDRLLMDFVVSLFWFNPFIYLYRNALIEIHEFQADEVVLNRFNDPIGYQEILYSQLQSARYSGLVSHFNFSMIKKRIVMMNKQRKMSGWVYALTIPVTLMVVFAFSSKDAMEPLNEVGDEIASMIGSEIDSEEPQLVPVSDQQEDIPSISPISGSDGVRMTSGFGMRMHPIEKVKKMHFGMDFACKTGTEILATADGEVKSVTHTKGYGKMITLIHGDDYQTKYAQLSEFKVAEGDKVRKGDVIALSGNSGASTAPHLHYEILKGGKRVDPADYIKDYNFKAKPSYNGGTAHVHEEEAEEEVILAEQARMLAEEEKLIAEKERELAMQEEVMAKREREKAEMLKIEQSMMEEKIRFDDSKQSRSSGTIEVFPDTDPLYVVNGEIIDGVPDFEPSDVSTVSVLKGESARTKYGNRGSNGVVEIETKGKGKNKSKGKNKNKTKGKSKTKSKGKSGQTAYRVIIDPGHGGKDSGASSVDGFQEKDLALEVSKIVGSHFSDRDDIEILFTREDDDFVSLHDRAEASIGADLMISIHVNSDPDVQKKDVNVFVDAQNKFFQESLKVSEVIGAKFTQINREPRIGVANLFLMKSTDCPSVLLEIGYLSNDSDLTYITSELGKKEIAATIASAIETSVNI